MLTTALLVIGTIAFVLLGRAMYGRRGAARVALSLTAVALLVGLVWVSMVFVPPY